jgi:hypothetical protein
MTETPPYSTSMERVEEAFIAAGVKFTVDYHGKLITYEWHMKLPGAGQRTKYEVTLLPDDRTLAAFADQVVRLVTPRDIIVPQDKDSKIVRQVGQIGGAPVYFDAHHERPGINSAYVTREEGEVSL